MAKCGDCVFCGTAHGLRWESSEHCNYYSKDIDSDDSACPNFVDESKGCCYDCDHFHNGSIIEKCEYHNKKIPCASSYRCSHFSG